MCVCKVGEEPAKSQVSLASSNQLSLTVTETDLSNLTASIRRPSGHEEPCGLRRQPSGQLGNYHTEIHVLHCQCFVIIFYVLR